MILLKQELMHNLILLQGMKLAFPQSIRVDPYMSDIFQPAYKYPLLPHPPTTPTQIITEQRPD